MKPAAVLSAVLTALIVLASPAAMADKGHLKQCVDRTVNGPKKIEFRQIGGHTFHCKPVTRTDLGKGRIRVQGTLVHEHFGPDDKVIFTFIKKNGKMEDRSLRQKIVKGIGPGDVLGELKKLLKEVPIPYVPNSVSDKGIEKAIGKVESEVAGPWESTAKKIVKLIIDKELLRTTAS